MDYEKLFNEVFSCDGEESLHKLVTTNDLFKNQNNWYPYGGQNKDDRGNFATFENQQPESGAALVEKITNSIDALLLKKCKQQHIDPKSSQAPETIEKATELFFDIPHGEIGELSSKDRVQMARDNIQLIANGGDEAPDLIIWDNGEGQHPDNFKHTFLSIGKSNKTDIAFVQGKYNMGSTGAVVFCGKHRYQLIASKRNDKIFNIEQKNENNLFGWTLVRKHFVTKEDDSKNPWYEYFAINGEIIPQFTIDELDIGLYEDKKFTTGSFAKLYSYEMPRGTRGSLTSGLYVELNQLLYKSALPIFLFERRKKYQTIKARLDIAVYGQHVQINSDNESERAILEHPPFYHEYKDSEIGHLKVQAIVFKKGENEQQQKDRKRRRIGAGRNIVYIVNGQVHGKQGVSLISNDLKYHLLKDSMLIVIDCSNLETNFRSDILMANRSTLKVGDQLDKLRNIVIDLLKNDSKLKELHTQRKNEILQGGDDKEEQKLISNLLAKVPLDKSLTNLLKKGQDLIKLPTVREKTGEKGEKEKRPIESKRFPSLFKINIKQGSETGKKIKSIPLDGKGVIEFETDVVNDYFYRPQEKGEFQIHILGGKSNNDSDNPNPQPSDIPSRVEDSFEVSSSGPSEGSIKLTLKPKENLNVGDEIELNARLTSPDGDMESIFHVKIIDPQKQELQQKHKEPEQPDLPKIIKITQRDDGKWQQDNGNVYNEGEWSANKIIDIIPSNEGDKKVIDAIAINMDSNVLKQYVSSNNAKNETKIDILRRQYLSKVFLHGLFLYSILDKMNSQENDNSNYRRDEESVEDKISQIFEHYSNVLIRLDTNTELMNAISDE